MAALTHPDRNIGIIGVGRSELSKNEWLSKMKKTVFKNEAEFFINDLKFIASLSPSSAINYILKKMGYAKYIRDFSYKNGMDASIYNDHAATLLKEAAAYRHIGDFISDMQEKKEHAII